MNFEGALNFTKLSVWLGCCWPIKSNLSSWRRWIHEVAWFMSIVCAAGLFLPLTYSIYEYRNDSLLLTKSVCFLGAVSGFIVKTIVCRIQQGRMQYLICEMEDFLKNLKPHECTVLESYVSKCSLLHASVTFINYATTFFVICGPFFMSDEAQVLPTTAVYLFDIDHGPLMYLVYAHQSFVGFQCSAGATIDCQAAFFIWYVGARLEILAAEFSRINHTEKLYEIIREHQKLLRLADEAKQTISYIALTTATTSGIATVFSCLQLVGNQPMSTKMQFGPFALASITCLFICAWPADNLINACGLIGIAAYDSPWTDMSPEMMRNILMIIQRSQRPATASVGGFIPALSLRYYASFLSAAFSYFTTLQAAVSSN